MLEILLTALVCGGVYLWSASGRAPGRFANLSVDLRREHLALALIILSSHSRVARAGAVDTLSNPFALEVVLRGLFVVAAIVVLAPAAMKAVRLATVVRRSWWGIGSLVVYAAAATLSIVYSPALLQTAGKVIELVALVLLTVHLVSTANPIRAVRNTLIMLIAIELALLLVSVLGFFLVPSLFAPVLSRPGFFFAGTLEGPLGSANNTSATGGMLVAVALAAWMSAAKDRRSWIWVVMGGAGALAVALASGRQGVAIMIGALALVIAASNRQAFFLILVPAAAAVLLAGAEDIYQILLRDQVAGSVRTLTGRTVFWEAAWDAFLKQPLTGYGFGSSRFSVLEGIGADQYTHVHNGYLEALVGMGLIGFIPFMVSVARSTWWSTRSLLRGEDVWLAVIMPSMLVQNMLGQGFGGWLNTNLMLFALVVAYADLRLTTPAGDVAFEIDVTRFRRSRSRRFPQPAIR